MYWAAILQLAGRDAVPSAAHEQTLSALRFVLNGKTNRLWATDQTCPSPFVIVPKFR